MQANPRTSPATGLASMRVVVVAIGFAVGGCGGGADTSADAGAVTDSSGGSEGRYPGRQTRQAEFDGTIFDYYLYIPTAYSPAVPLPLLTVFHGEGSDAPTMVDYWQVLAQSKQVVVLATNATGSGGAWNSYADAGNWIAAVADTVAAYSIDEAHVYAWGFSSGGDFAHWLILKGTNAADYLAAYAVTAGTLDATDSGDGPATARFIPVDIHIGRSDGLLAAAQTDRQRFIDGGWVAGDTLNFVEFDGGHEIQTIHLAAILDFLVQWTSGRP